MLYGRKNEVLCSLNPSELVISEVAGWLRCSPIEKGGKQEFGSWVATV